MTTLLNLERYFALFNYSCKTQWTALNEKSKSALLKSKVEAQDTETTGLDIRSSKVQTTHISYWTNAGKGRSFPVSNHEERSKLAARAASTDVTKVYFNAPFDIRALDKAGVDVRGLFVDVLLVAQMTLPDEKIKKLKHLARKFLKDPFLEELRLKKWLASNPGKAYGHAPAHIIEPYNLADSKRTLELFYYLSGALDAHKQWPVLLREMILMRKVVMPMEDIGIGINLEEVDRLKIAVRKELQGIKKELIAMTGNADFNPNSPAQLLKALKVEGVWKPSKFSRKTGSPTTDVISLLEYPSKLGSLVVKFRKLLKAGSTYLKHFDKPVLRVSFYQNGARTGRFSCSGPNLQNIPRPKEDSLLSQMRRCFVPQPRCRLLLIDYKQLQLRLAAHFSGEEHMLQSINNGEDLHDKTCMLVFERTKESPDWDIMRYLAKTYNFSILFGAGAERIRETVLKDTDGKIRLQIHTVARYLSEWKTKHPGIMRYFDKIALEVAQTGGITTFYGRYLPVDSSASYVGVNYAIQGAEADFIKMKCYAVTKFLAPYKTRLVMVVHDELVFNLHPDEKHLIKQLISIMEDRTTFHVPLVCSASIGKNWLDKVKINI